MPVVHRRPHGCIVSGSIEVQKVPGSLHIMAYSKHHDIPAELIDLSHRVNHFSFGEVAAALVRRGCPSSFPPKNAANTTLLLVRQFPHFPRHQ